MVSLNKVLVEVECFLIVDFSISLDGVAYFTSETFWGDREDFVVLATNPDFAEIVALLYNAYCKDVAC